MAKGDGNRSTPAGPSGQVGYDQPQGCFLRVFWMAVGNVGLLAIAWFIFTQDRFSLLDALYWVVVASLAGARYLDITRYGGKTADGTPATPQSFRRYALGLVVVAAALWAAVHALRFLW